MEPRATKRCPRCEGVYDAAAGFCQRDGSRLVDATPGEAPDPLLGRVLLEQFRVEEVIGAGGMGTVYRARQTTLDRDVAIKVLHRDLVQNADALRRFQREARIATALDHEGLVRVFLLGRLDDGSLYLVMEYLRGQSLSDLLREQGPMDLERALGLALQLCEAVGEAHAHGVVHRDVKPDNVIVVPRGKGEQAKVLDFGVARLLYDAQTVLTQSGVIFGTARYISPEGAAGDPTDARSDVYSIAVLLFQLLAGETPFDGASPVALLMKHLHTPPPHLRNLAPAVPEAIAGVVMRGLEKDPGRRPADARAFGEALREAGTRAGLALGADASVAGAWSPGRASAGVTPRTEPALANDPTPTGDPASGPAPSPGSPQPAGRSVELPTRRGPATAGMVLLAFLLGAGAVTAGAWLVGRLPSPSSSAEPVAQRSTPGGDHTADPPRTEPAASPSAEPERDPGIHVVPSEPEPGDDVTLLAVLGDGAFDDDGTPRFRVTRGGRTVATVEASRGPHARSWLATVQLRRPGSHEVTLETGARGDRAELLHGEVQVQRPERRSVARRRRPDRADRAERETPWKQPVIAPAVDPSAEPAPSDDEEGTGAAEDGSDTTTSSAEPSEPPASEAAEGSTPSGPTGDPGSEADGEPDDGDEPPAPWTGSGTLL